MVDKLLLLLIFSLYMPGCATLSNFHESKEQGSDYYYHQGYSDGFEKGCRACQGKSDKDAETISFFEKDDY